MHLGRYQLLTPLGAGVDGVAYRAETGGDGRPLEHVELRILSGAAADAERWEKLRKRLRVASLLQHPNAIVVRERNLEANPPYVAMAWPEPGNLAEQGSGHRRRGDDRGPVRTAFLGAAKAGGEVGLQQVPPCCQVPSGG